MSFNNPIISIKVSGAQFEQQIGLILGCGCLIARAWALDITLDPDQPGRTFEGIELVSARASSRLLVDYPEFAAQPGS